ncbi:hypothetical protein Pan241w_11770 [Gimesia alba]|uniref:Zinc-finger domain-containing protein n=1 Tax=Gimesia alba TaxID=2527973 RepID=A0A517RB48_9PLAN|nr:hypothetical protein [Gimesia alba]QDT41117.1 hypothetical protein Pan241w_11770 [Gimesia alba]
MSSQPPSNENLSAYFDHEVSPEERRELEALLEESPETRQELHEFGELSRLLQETATESAPPELAASIRRRIEQETLLTETTPATVKRAPSMLRYRIAVAISTCSSVAALVLFILLMNIPDPAQQFANVDGLAAKTPAEAEKETLVFSRHKTIPQDDYNVALNDSVSSGKQGKATVTTAPSVALRSAALPPATELDRNEGIVMPTPDTRKMKGDFSVTNSFAESKVAEKLSDFSMPVEPQPASGIPSHIPVDSIRIGDAFPYFSEINGKVAVIEVRVVDVKQALGTMEFLLARNNIPVNQQKQSDIERQLQSTRNLKTKTVGQKVQDAQGVDNSDHELFAVYVEATDTQLASALQEFQKDLKQDQLVGLTLQPAINESSLTEAVGELPQLLAYQQQSTNTTIKERESKRVSDLTLNKQNEARKPLARGAPVKKFAAADVKQKLLESEPKKQRSYQTRYRMQLPAETLNRKARVVQQGAPSRNAVSKLETSVNNQPLVASKPGLSPNTQWQYLGKTPVSNSPVKVLFVFKGTATPATPPAPN